MYRVTIIIEKHYCKNALWKSWKIDFQAHTSLTLQPTKVMYTPLNLSACDYSLPLEIRINNRECDTMPSVVPLWR